jgi:uncharacterized protein (DUF58 family)
MDTEFFKELDKFSLLVKKRVSTTYTGGRKSLRYGRGITPVGYREYRKGDDFKLVDWKAYGRTEKLYVREHEEERSLVVHIILDASESMGYDRKFEYASQIAAGFAYIATLENEKYVISRFSVDLDPGEPRRGRRYLFQTIDELDRTSPHGQTNLKKVSEQFNQLIRSTSLVVVVSDFLEDTDDIVSSIYRLSGHDLIVIHLMALDEAEMKLGGDVRFVDMETLQPLITRVSEKQREQYRKKLEEHLSKIKATCNAVGADFFSFRTDKPIFDAFSELNAKATIWRA